MCTWTWGTRSLGTLPFLTFLSLDNSPRPAPGCLCRQRAEPRAVTRRSEGSEGPAQTNQHLTLLSPRTGDNRGWEEPLAFSSPVRSGGPEPLQVSPSPKMLYSSSPPLSHRALGPAGGGAHARGVLQPHVVAKPRSPDSQSRADGPPWPLGDRGRFPSASPLIKRMTSRAQSLHFVTFSPHQKMNLEWKAPA